MENNIFPAKWMWQVCGKETGPSEDCSYRLSRHTPGLRFKLVQGVKCVLFHSRRLKLRNHPTRGMYGRTGFVWAASEAEKLPLRFRFSLPLIIYHFDALVWFSTAHIIAEQTQALGTDAINFIGASQPIRRGPLMSMSLKDTKKAVFLVKLMRGAGEWTFKLDRDFGFWYLKPHKHLLMDIRT